MNDNNVILLLWSLPIAFGLHVFEEFIFPGGLPRWIRAYKSDAKSNFYYFFLNAAAWVGALVLALKPSVAGLYVCAGFIALMAGNSVSHIRGTLQKKQYCPGTASSVALLLPLFVVSHWYLLSARRLDWQALAINVAIGIFVGFYLFGVDVRRADNPA
jgi:hypothetical protein